MRSTQCARYASRNAVTTSTALVMLITLMFISPLRSFQPLEPKASRAAALEAGFQSSPSRRDGDVVQSLHTQPPVELVLAPIGLDAVDGPISHMQEPDLVQVHVLLLVDDAKEVRGLCSLNGDLGDGGAIIADEESAHAH